MGHIERSPLSELLRIEEINIAEFLWSKKIVTPHTTPKFESIEEGLNNFRNGFVNLVVYNPFDGSLYNKFSISPVAAALGRSKHKIDNVDFVECEKQILDKYSTEINNILNHIIDLVVYDNFLPLFFPIATAKKQNLLDWLRTARDEPLSVGHLNINDLISLFPLHLDQVIDSESRTYKSDYPLPNVYSIDLADAFSSFSENTRNAESDELRRYRELQHILDAVLLIPWVAPHLNYTSLIQGLSNDFSKASMLLQETDSPKHFSKVVVPIIDRHTPLGVCVVAWEEPDPESKTNFSHTNAQELQVALSFHAKEIGSKVRTMRDSNATVFISRGDINNAAIQILGPASLTTFCNGYDPVDLRLEKYDTIFQRFILETNNQHTNDCNTHTLDLTNLTHQCDKINYRSYINVENKALIPTCLNEIVLRINILIDQCNHTAPLDYRRFNATKKIARQLLYSESRGNQSVTHGHFISSLVLLIVAGYMRNEDRVDLPGDGVYFRLPDSSDQLGLASYLSPVNSDPLKIYFSITNMNYRFNNKYNGKRIVTFIRKVIESDEKCIISSYFRKLGMHLALLDSGKGVIVEPSTHACYIAVLKGTHTDDTFISCDDEEKYDFIKVIPAALSHFK